MNSQLQNKLLHYEVQPPEGVWNKIDASLEEHIPLAFIEKLYQYEEEPSPYVWENLNFQLGKPTSNKAKVVPFYVRYRKPLKYSGAVATFIFLAVLTSLLISKKSESELPPEGIANAVTTKKDTAKSPADQENNSVAQLTEKNRGGRLTPKSKVSRISQEEFQNSNSSSFESLLPQQAERNEIVNSSASSDKYMIYSDGDGNAIRLPKKIFSAFACPAEDLICKQRLQQLREKFAASAMTADFTGLLQILKSLQENQ